MKYGLLLAFLLLFSGTSIAQTVSVKTRSAELWSTPSQGASDPLLKVPRFYPLQVLGAKDGYYKAQDYRARVGWIEKTEVADTKTVVVRVHLANLRKGPSTEDPIILKAYSGVSFRVLKEKGKWLEVLHASGRKGWIFKSLTWGW